MSVSDLYFPIKDGHINDIFKGGSYSREETTVFQLNRMHCRLSAELNIRSVPTLMVQLWVSVASISLSRIATSMVLELEFLHYSIQLYNWGDCYLTTLEVCKMFGQKFGQTKQSVVPYLNGPVMSVSGLYFPIEDGHINDLGAWVLTLLLNPAV